MKGKTTIDLELLYEHMYITEVAPGDVSDVRFNALLNTLTGLQSELKKALSSNYQAIAIIYNGIIKATAEIQEDLNAQLDTMQNAMDEAGERVDLRSVQPEPAGGPAGSEYSREYALHQQKQQELDRKFVAGRKRDRGGALISKRYG